MPNEEVLRCCIQH